MRLWLSEASTNLVGGTPECPPASAPLNMLESRQSGASCVQTSHTIGSVPLKTHEVDVVVEEQPVVLVLDDDPGIRAALAQLLAASGMRVLLFASAAELLSGVIPNAPCCLL